MLGQQPCVSMATMSSEHTGLLIRASPEISEHKDNLSNGRGCNAVALVQNGNSESGRGSWRQADRRAMNADGLSPSNSRKSLTRCGWSAYEHSAAMRDHDRPGFARASSRARCARLMLRKRFTPSQARGRQASAVTAHSRRASQQCRRR